MLSINSSVGVRGIPPIPNGYHRSRGVRFVYQDELGEFCRVYNKDSKDNRHSFIESLQGTTFCYSEEDIQKFLNFKHQKAIIVENI